MSDNETPTASAGQPETLYASSDASLERILDIGGSILYEGEDGEYAVGEIRNAGAFGYLLDDGNRVPFPKVTSVIRKEDV